MAPRSTRLSAVIKPSTPFRSSSFQVIKKIVDVNVFAKHLDKFGIILEVLMDNRIFNSKNIKGRIN